MNTLREDLDEVFELRSSVTQAIAYQLLLRAWSSTSYNNTQDIYHKCALDIISNPDSYHMESCTKGLLSIQNIMDKRNDELEILNGQAYFNISLSNKNYNKAMLDKIESMSPSKKKERTSTLCDSEFLIKEI